MAVDNTNVELTFSGIVAATPIDVDIMCYSADHVKVYYGATRVLATPGTHYSVTLSPDDYDSFTVTPTTALVNAVAAIDEDDTSGTIYVRRALPYTTDFQPSDAFIRERIVREADRTIMRFQQIDLAVDELQDAVDDIDAAVTASAASAAASASSASAAASSASASASSASAAASSASSAATSATTASTASAAAQAIINGALASQAEAEAGSNNTHLMTPLRVKQEIQAVTLTLDQMNNAETLAAIIARTGLTPAMLGALSTDTSHDVCWNNCIDRLITAGGGTLWLPPIANDWKLGGQVNLHKTGYTDSYLTVQGVGDKARVKWLGTTGEMFVGGDGTNPVYNITLKNLQCYTAGTRTAGIDFLFRKANIIRMEDCISDGSFNGFYGIDLNTVYVKHVQINMPNLTNGCGFTIYSDPSGSGRTDIAKFEEITVYARNAGSNGMIVNGRVFGVHVHGGYMLGVRRGLQLISTGTIAGDVPGFCDFRKFETDRALEVSVVLDKAFRTEFSRCDLSNTSEAADSPYPQGGNDTVAMLIGTGAIDTKFIGGRIGNCQLHGIEDRGRGTTFIGTSVTDVAKDGGVSSPAIYLGAEAEGFLYQGCMIDGFSRAAYAIQMEAATSNGLIVNNRYQACGAYSAGTGTGVTNSGQVETSYTYTP
jgi:hypothetical protein